MSNLNNKVVKDYVKINGSEFNGQSVSDIRDVVTILSTKVKLYSETKKDSDGCKEKLKKENEDLNSKCESKDAKIEELEKANAQSLKYIECIQKDCEQVVSAKEEWLHVMRSFKESEEKV